MVWPAAGLASYDAAGEPGAAVASPDGAAVASPDGAALGAPLGSPDAAPDGPGDGVGEMGLMVQVDPVVPPHAASSRMAATPAVRTRVEGIFMV